MRLIVAAAVFAAMVGCGQGTATEPQEVAEHDHSRIDLEAELAAKDKLRQVAIDDAASRGEFTGTASVDLDFGFRGEHSLSIVAHLDAPKDWDVLGASGTLTVTDRESSNVLWSGPIDDTREISNRGRIVIGVAIPYDDSDPKHRDLRAAGESFDGDPVARLDAKSVTMADGSARQW